MMTTFDMPENLSNAPNPYPIPMHDNPILRQTISVYENILISITSSGNVSNSKGSAKFFSNFKQTFINQHYSSGAKDDAENEILNGLLTLKITKLPTSTTVNQFTANKKQFEEDSKKYYDFVSKWLAQGYGLSAIDCPAEKQERLLKKKKTWTAARLTYFNWLYQEIVQLYLNQQTFKDVTYSKIRNFFFESEPARRGLIHKTLAAETNNELDTILMGLSVLEVYDWQLTLVSSNERLLACVSGIKYFLDSKENKMKSVNGPSKSEILFTQHGQKKPGWHKQWVVIRNGKCLEYMDWRSCRNLRNEGLTLGLCNIKSVDPTSPSTQKSDIAGADSIGNRKNCFRILSNLGVEHTFQLMTSVGIEGWLHCIETDARVASSSRKSTLRSISSIPSSSNTSLKSTELSANGPRNRRVSSVTSTCLKSVHFLSSSNRACCDCGAENPDWISINLLVVFCIKCSASHRALGSSVSKVRSLSLDTFKDETRYLIEHGVDNKKSNSFWEATLLDKKTISEETNAGFRNQFIKSKYVDKQWISTISNDPDTIENALRIAVDQHDYHEIIRCIASGYDIKTDETNIFQYSLKTPLVNKKGRRMFDVSELLVLNGAPLKEELNETLDATAKVWLQEKINKFKGISTSKPASFARPKLSHIDTASAADEPKKSKSPRDGFNKLKKKVLG